MVPPPHNPAQGARERSPPPSPGAPGGPRRCCPPIPTGNFGEGGGCVLLPPPPWPGRSRCSPAVVDEEAEEDEHEQGQGTQDGEEEDGVVGGDVCHTRCHGHQPWGQRGQRGDPPRGTWVSPPVSGTARKGNPQSTPGGCDVPPASMGTMGAGEELPPHQEHPKVLPPPPESRGTQRCQLTCAGGGQSRCPVSQLGGDECPVELPALPADQPRPVPEPQPCREGGGDTLG